MKKTRWIFVAALLAVSLPATLFAQDIEDVPPEEESALPSEIEELGEEGEGATEEGATEEAAEGEAAEGEGATEGEGAETAAATEGEPVEEYKDDAYKDIDPSDKLYWSTMRDVYTVQKRYFQKDGRFGITAYGGLIPNNIFEQYFPVGLRLNYFFLENLGIELAGSYAFKSDTRLRNLLQEETGASAQQVLIGDTQLSHTNFGIVWSPFYGKTSFYNSALNYFDLYLFAGAGLVITETIPDFNAPPEQEFKPEGALGAGIAFYLGEHSALRFDFRQFVFQKVAGVGGGVANPSEVSIGFGWFL